MSEPTPRAELVLYATEDGSAQFFLRAEDGSVWLSQSEIAELFQTSVPNVNIHIKNVLDEQELSEARTIKDDLIVRMEGTRQVRRTVKLYNLDMILAIGYRVKSPRGTQFRQWATTHLREYLVKGFVIDDERLKGGDRWDYFDELLQRIRDIRASEKRFYQKVRDLFALSVDYADDGEATGLFFAEVQNKMFFAVTGKTAAELVVQRADPAQPNMALTSWKGGRVRKADVTVAKNYLNADELDQLNRIVTMFLDFAELRAMQRKNLRMADWRAYVDSFMTFNEQPVLQGAGRMSHQAMTTIAHERYEQFDATRRKTEALAADRVDLHELEQVEKQLNSSRQSKKGGEMLPDGWRDVLLDSVAQRGSGHTPSKDNPDNWNGGVKWVSLADSWRLDRGYVEDTDKMISDIGIQNSSAVIHPAGTVVMSRDAGVGKSGVLASPMAVSQHFIAWDCSKSKELHNWFLYHWLQYEKPEFERIAVGSTIKTIGLPYFKRLKIKLPPLAEQQRIAEILGAWDTAIFGARRLLVNSRKQKQALIQRLIFRGSGEHHQHPLSAISERVQRRSDGENPVLMISAATGFLRQDQKYSRFMAGKSLDDYILLKRGEFAYNKGNSKLYEFGCVFPLEDYEQGLVPHVYVCFKLNEICHPEFFKYLFEADYLHDQLGAMVNTGVRNNGLLNIRPDDFMNVKVPVPPIERQRYVAGILAAASEEIKLLQANLHALQTQKHALMVDLLTGKRRVHLSQPTAEPKAA